ncbi:MAG: T9SS type A sorting domain-containing protein [Flavobacteriales bacterium]|nr:T9SS type A sorting domain-containing protein [Flavobacteriales bacterium]
MMRTLITILIGSILPTTVAGHSGEHDDRNTSPFIPNTGQFVDQHGQPNPAVRHMLQRPGLNLQVRADGFSYDLHRFEGDAWRFHRIDVEVVGADPHAKVLAEEPETLTHFHREARLGHVRITCKDILPHIDLVLQLDEAGMPKYDFVVRTGGHADDIRLRYHGAEVTLREDGALVLNTMLGPVTERIPLAYVQDTGQPVAAQYHLHTDGSVGIATQRIRMGATLVIDPTIAWGTYLGGSGIDRGNAVVANSERIFSTGETRSPANMATAGAHQGTWAGNKDVYVACHGMGGQLIWCTYLGGSADDEGLAITLNGDRLFVAGRTASGTGIATAGSHQPAHQGADDGFLACFDLDGALQWSTYFGGTGADAVNGVSSANGLVAITGTSGSLGLGTPGTHQPNKWGLDDAFVALFDLDGALQWCSYFGANENEEGFAVHLRDGIVPLAGTTRSQQAIATEGAHHTTWCAGNHMGYLARFDTEGQRIWSTYIGCGADIVPRAVAIQDTSLFVAGGHLIGGGNNWYPLVRRYGLDGSLGWVTNYYGNASDQANAIAVDPAGVYIAGHTHSLDGISTPGAHQTGHAGGLIDAFVARLDHHGALKWGSYFGGTLGEHAFGIAVQGPSVIITGASGSLNGIATPGAQQGTNGGAIDAFVARFNSWGVGVEEYAPATDALPIHPNPSSGPITVDLGTDVAFSHVTITDAQGQLVLVHSRPSTGGTTILDLSHLPPGTYLLSAHGTNGIRNGRVVIAR